MNQDEMYKDLEEADIKIEALQKKRVELDKTICALQHKIVERRAEIKLSAQKTQFESSLFILGFEREDAIRACENTLNVYYQNLEINRLFIAYTLGVQDGRTEDQRKGV